MPFFRVFVLIGAATLSSVAVADEAPEQLDARAMAARVDALLREAWQASEVRPAERATDSEFLRRVYLDLTGHIPRVSEVQEFLEDGDSDKRSQLVERLLRKPRHADHFANIWRRFLLPERLSPQFSYRTPPFHNWLRGAFARNQPYDATVRELLLATGPVNQSGPVLFYSVLKAEPAELAASTSRALLGVQIQCAQCHDHPFDHWTQADFWGYAAFFAQLQRPASNPNAFLNQVMDVDNGEVNLPDSDQIVPARLLGGTLSADSAENTRRQRLADWLTSDENRFFARATVNRVWSILFGRGIVDPVDDLGQHNPGSTPEVLDELAVYFIQTGYDMRELVRAIASTQAYHLSSRSDSDDPAAASLFARMSIKTLTAEQLYDCLNQAATWKPNATVARAGYRINQNRVAFLNQFRTPSEMTGYNRGIPQALTLMNGRDITGATDLQTSDMLVALQAPFLTDQQRVEVLFLATLSRQPRDRERESFVAHVASASTSDDKTKALSDVLWALLNSAEFTLNH